MVDGEVWCGGEELSLGLTLLNVVVADELKACQWKTFLG